MDPTGRAKALMEAEFLPTPGGLKEELRIATAAEYSAHQLFQIRKALGRIADSLEKIAAKP